jgi:hypothetical protein
VGGREAPPALPPVFLSLSRIQNGREPLKEIIHKFVIGYPFPIKWGDRYPVRKLSDKIKK